MHHTTERIKDLFSTYSKDAITAIDKLPRLVVNGIISAFTPQ